MGPLKRRCAFLSFFPPTTTSGGEPPGKDGHGHSLPGIAGSTRRPPCRPGRPILHAQGTRAPHMSGGVEGHIHACKDSLILPSRLASEMASEGTLSVCKGE